MIGEPDAGNPHVRFDEGDRKRAFARRACLLLYTREILIDPHAPSASIGGTVALALRLNLVPVTMAGGATDHV